MNINEAKDDGFSQEGSLFTSEFDAEIQYTQDFKDDTVQLTIDGQWFKKQDLKELRKFLKLLINEMPA